LETETKNENKVLLNPKEAAREVGVSVELIKTWTNHFGLDQFIQRSAGGHRRYKTEAIERLLDIKEKLHVLKWSYDDVKNYYVNGEDDHEFTIHEERSELEKKVDKILEHQELQQDFYRMLTSKMDSLTREMEVLKLENSEMNRVLTQRDEVLLENIRKIQEEKPKKRKGWLFKFFS